MGRKGSFPRKETNLNNMKINV